MDARSLIFVAFAAIVPAVHAWDWRTDWRMRGDIYRTFDFTVRGGIDRASKAFDKAVTDEFRGGQSEQDRIASFRAAAAEWRKVQVQSETGDFDEKILSYALFMQGCARERAKDSNEALRLYSEVIELYSDITWVSVPAKLRLGCLQMSMGDVRKGEATLMELLDDPASQKTVARAIAQRIMGDRLWNAGKFDDAIACFREVMGTEIAGESRRNAARDRLVAIALARGDYSNFDELTFFGVQNGDAPRLDAVRRMFDTVCYVWLRNLGWNDFGARSLHGSRGRARSMPLSGGRWTTPLTACARRRLSTRTTWCRRGSRPWKTRFAPRRTSPPRRRPRGPQRTFSARCRSTTSPAGSPIS